MKRGILHEARNVDIEIEVPMENSKNIMLRIKSDHITIKIDEKES